MSTRNRFLDALRAARHDANAQANPDPTANTDRGMALAALHRRLEDLEFARGSAAPDHFAARARESGSTVLRCTDLADAARSIIQLVSPHSRCILAAEPLIEAMGLAAALVAQSCTVASVRDADLGRGNPAARREYAAANVGITVARAGLADSGAIIISSSECESRSVSLLAERHVALLPASRIVPSLRQAAAMLRDLTTDGSSAVTLVGGPSKTADIEKVLVTGVHGPSEFVIVIIDDTEGQ